jgi:molybdopterin converting factor small subunit
VHGFLSFLVNGKNINVLQGFDTELKQGDTVAILPPVGGG